MRQGKGALGRAQVRRRRRYGERHGRGSGPAFGGRRRERVGEGDRHLVPGQAHRQLHGEECLHGGDRIVRRGVLDLSRVHRRQVHVELAHVAHFAPQLRHVAQAVGGERVTSREPRPGGGREGAGVGGIDVEANRGALERHAVVHRVPRRRRGVDAGRADPRQLERQIRDHVVVGDVLGVGRPQRRVGIEPRPVERAGRRRKVGTPERGARAARQSGLYCLGARDGPLRGEGRRSNRAAQRDAERQRSSQRHVVVRKPTYPTCQEADTVSSIRPPPAPQSPTGSR